MNIFKNVFKATLVLALLFLYSCEKDQNDSNNNMLTEEISKVETRYQEGDIKIENTLDPNFQKIETSAVESYKKKIIQALEDSYSKQTTYLKSAGNKVGVIKSGTCGSYQELMVFMDCEDGSNNISSVNEWVGDCGRDSNGNITLRFCVVNGAYFERTNSNYAVLNLTGLSSWPYGMGYIYRYFDNEDNNNANSFTLDGTPLWNYWFGRCYLGSNIGLGFYHYIANSSSPTYPNLGFSYGVFGQFGNSKGSIITDDEDNKNANSCQVASYDYANLRLGNLYNRTTNIPDILNVGANTTLFVCKIN